VRGTAYGSSNISVYGYSSEGYIGYLAGNGYGVYGSCGSKHGYLGSTNYGVCGYGSAGIAVFGLSSSSMGVYGSSPSGFGVYGYTDDGYAVYFFGNVRVIGAFFLGGGPKSFVIDNPLDPSNKYLYHFCVESDELSNVYSGNAVLNANREAIIELPDWFEALNKDFRYQLTAIGEPGPNLYIAEEISDNSFKIAGGKPGMKVYWQVTGIRQDAFANAHRIQVEVEKEGDEQGKYLHPKEQGVSETLGMDYEERMRMEGEQRRMEEAHRMMEDYENEK
jgi:hypothetical protein